jgi:hypothetical protein
LFTALMILQDGAMNLWFIYPVKWALVMWLNWLERFLKSLNIDSNDEHLIVWLAVLVYFLSTIYSAMKNAHWQLSVTVTK